MSTASAARASLPLKGGELEWRSADSSNGKTYRTVRQVRTAVMRLRTIQLHQIQSNNIKSRARRGGSPTHRRISILTATIFLLLAGLMGAGGIVLAAAGAHAAAAAATSGSAGYMLLFQLRPWSAAPRSSSTTFSGGRCWLPRSPAGFSAPRCSPATSRCAPSSGTGSSPWRRQPAASFSSLRGSRSSPPRSLLCGAASVGRCGAMVAACRQAA